MSKNKSKLVYAWAAGIIDGEGSVMLSHTDAKTHRVPVVSVSNTDLNILSQLKKIFGGCICNNGRRSEKHKLAYTWKVTHNRALLCLTQVVNMLQHTTKCRRAQHLLRSYKQVTRRNGKYTARQLQIKQRFETEFKQLL